MTDLQNRGTILVVDDDPLVLEVLIETFRDDYEVLTAVSGAEALETVKNCSTIDAIILDIRMERMDGLTAALKIKEIDIDIPIVFHTGYPGDYSEQELENKYQPFDYVGKNERPIRLERSVRHAVEFHKLNCDRNDLMGKALHSFGMVGESVAMQTVYRAIARVGPSQGKVMILGPTGSGKELVARAIHAQSDRATQRLVVFNCSHKSNEVAEAELFGSTKAGAGEALNDQVGLLAYADGGTLFMDEICDLGFTTQAKLLRVLESGEMCRHGSPEVTSVDVRLICATRHDLTGAVSQGILREDLFYRLKGVVIVLPALQERREDIPRLIDFFAENSCARNRCSLKIFQPEARQLLVEFDWPGNVRQLADTVQALIDLTPSSLITKTDVEKLLDFHGSDASPKASFQSRVRDYKRTLLISALDANNHNMSAAARSLSLDPSNFRKLAKTLNLR